MSRLPITIDAQYLLPEFAAAYLVPETDRALFVENNTSRSIPMLLEALHRSGFRNEQVEYVIITHVHLDHAGGTSALMKACPQAVLLAHPRAAPHMIDPSRLVQSARQVYGEQEFERLYGQIDPVDPHRVRVVEDEETIQFGSRSLKFLYTRGHANHHFCILDSGSEGIFTGDSFGVAYPVLQTRGLFIFPSTSPTDFDPVEAKKSVHKIANSGAKRAFLTHFGEVKDLKEAESQLIEHLNFSEKLLNQSIESKLSDSELNEFCEKEIYRHFNSVLAQRGIDVSPSVWDLLKLDLQLNAAGVAHVARKRRNIQKP